MDQLPFVWDEATSLLDEIKKPIEKITLYREIYRSGETVFSQPFSITLWHADGSGLKCYSQMTDIVGRIEVGSLHFKKVTEQATEDVELNAPFINVKAVLKLLIEESGTIAESGLIIVGDDDKDLTIVAADYPFALAISGVPIDHYTFRSEYLLHEYKKWQMV